MTMNIEKIYSVLDSDDSIHEKRAAAIAYLHECVDNLSDDPEERRKIAYNIAGLMSTNFASALEDDDSIEEILNLAGELEVNNDGKNEAEWQSLIDLISALRSQD